MNSNPFTEEHKKQIEKEIVDLVIAGLENNKISEKDLPQIGQFVLAVIDDLKDQQGLKDFLFLLSAQWPIFDSLEKSEKGRERGQEEKVMAEKVAELSREGKIEEAVDLAKKATEEK